MILHGVVFLVWMHAITQAVGLPAQDILIKPYYHDVPTKKFQLPNARRNDSYFGFSLTYDNYYRSLVITSPRYDNIGKVYDCDISKETCKPIAAVVDRYLASTYTHDYWLGATVKAGPDFIVTCAPRFTYSLLLTGQTKSKTGTFAQCYTRTKNPNELEIRPTITDSKRLKDFFGDTSQIKIETFMDSFGWSIDVSTMNNTSAVLVGGPAMYTGRVMVYEKIKSPHNSPKLLQRTRLLPEYNHGYSVASGDFFKIGQMVYAVGSTYGRHGAGSVYFFNKNRIYQLDKYVDKDVVGSMFGAVLCAAKFYENGLTDLLVGAPTFAMQHDHNKGVVYVYLASGGSNNNMKYLRIISNSDSQDGSYFGSAIVNLGDLNGDKSDDIAIAAPYEDNGRGAVYVYSGAKIISESKTVSWMQRIQPEGHIKSFGMSLAALNDYDNNGCKELAVGAPYDDTVFLYQCMASVTVNLTVESPNVQNRARENKTNFEYLVCHTVKYPDKLKNIIADLSTRVVFTHSSAKLSNPNPDGAYTLNTSLASRRSPLCHFVGFTLPSDGNYETEIDIFVTSKLMIDPYSLPSFDPRRVVLSDHSVLMKHDTLWAAECAGDKECLPNLTLTFIDETEVPYIIGSSKDLGFSMSVANTGDVAYDSFVLVFVFGATVSKPSQQCVPRKASEEIPPVAGAAVLVCTPINPIKTNNPWNSGSIVLNKNNLTNEDVRINIQALLFNHRKDINRSNKTYDHTIDLKSDPKFISLKGMSNIGESVKLKKNELNSGKVMEHKYTIKNTGTAKWVHLKCDVILEKKTGVTYLDIEKYECNKTSETSDYITRTCMLPTIGKDSINLFILIRVMSENTDIIAEDGLTIKSTVNLHLDGKSESVSTLVQLDDAMVPWWVILLAVLIGLFILVIIAFILHECGFLRRKKKKDLQALRKSIRRQTMRISAMPTSEDQRQILAQVAEENEGTQVIENKGFCDASKLCPKTETEDTDMPKKEQ